MGLLRNFLDDMKEKQKARDEMDDDLTTDRYLRSLRRQRRKQLEEFEKHNLKIAIKKHELERTRDDFLQVEKKKSLFLKKKIKKTKGFLSKGNL